ncbi:MAG: ATP-binding cassette domain-containing protein [Erysipelotrichaceae bacterium]|nr:ATP-binding cassette domain-containing protein [Erysipelotrichaceae bacterium]
MSKESFISLREVSKNFKVSGGLLRAVNKVSFDINKGETLGLVGESGCGKSTLGRVVMGVYQPSEGEIIVKGEPLHIKSAKDRYKYAKVAQMIFQDPYASLNPRMTVGDIIAEGMEIHKMYDAKKRKERVDELLETVGLNKEYASRFPHEFSGGQRQRIGIARALAIEPEFLVCDEPISALDVSIQSQIINLLIDLQQKLGLTYLFIAHDLDIVRYISDRIAVMYLGHVMEIGDSDEVYNNALHPYSQALLSAVPIPDPDMEKQKQRIILQGDVPSPIDVPKGCPFAGRCRYAKDKCSEERPELREVKAGHQVACHFVDEINHLK